MVGALGQGRYTVAEETLAVLAPNGTEAFSTAIAGFSIAERSGIAHAICELANGGHPALPAAVNHHWLVMGRWRTGETRLYTKAPVTIEEFARARTWQLFAIVQDEDLAFSLSALVNEHLGWEVAPDGTRRHVIDNKALVVYPTVGGDWHSRGGGMEARFRSPEDAMEAAMTAARGGPTNIQAVAATKM